MVLQGKCLASGAACPAERGPGLPASTLEWNFIQNEEEGLHLSMDNKEYVWCYLVQGTSKFKSLLSHLKQCLKWGFATTGIYWAPVHVCLLSPLWTLLHSKHAGKSWFHPASEWNQMPKPQNLSRNRILVSWPALLLNLNTIQHVSIFAHVVCSPYTCVNPTEVMYKGSGSKAVIEKVHVSLTFWYSLKILHLE